MALWLVRAGRDGEREDFAIEQNVAVIGWEELPNLSKIESREELAELMKQTYTDAKARTLANFTGQVWRFYKKIQPGDLVALPLKGRSFVAVGEVAGPYEYLGENDEGSIHTRRVKWIKEIPRTRFDQDLLYSLGAVMTVCQIKRNDAEVRVKRMLNIGGAATPTIDDDDTAEEESGVDLDSLARDQIRQLINRRFKGHELTRLVDAILRSQGFQTYVSPPGVDRGVDIVAGKGGLGFDSPKLVVEVKSGDEPADSGMVMKLQGAMRRLSAGNGLFVSWSGFKRSTDERELFFEIRLWDGDELIDQFLSNYENLDADIQAEIPVKHTWVLVPGESG